MSAGYGPRALGSRPFPTSRSQRATLTRTRCKTIIRAKTAADPRAAGSPPRRNVNVLENTRGCCLKRAFNVMARLNSPPARPRL